MKTFYLLFLGLLLSTAGARADVPTGNIWPNATFEAGESLEAVTGLPAGWNRGGNNSAICEISAANSVSPSHSLSLNDTDPAGYGEWYSDLNLAGLASPGDDLDLHWNEMFNVTGGEMRLTLTFFNAGGPFRDQH